MALTATIHHFEIAISDVDRSVYETLDLRVAQHPSETTRWLLLRTLAYALEWQDGIAFSKGGISSTDEPPISVRDPTGLLLRWIDVGVPSAERLHKAAKAAKVAVYTSELAQLRQKTSGATIHKREEIEVWAVDAAFLDALAGEVDRRASLSLTRTDGSLYVTVGGRALEATLGRTTLAGEPG